jgi:hypothetical protein
MLDDMESRDDRRRPRRLCEGGIHPDFVSGELMVPSCEPPQTRQRRTSSDWDVHHAYAASLWTSGQIKQGWGSRVVEKGEREKS